MYKKDLRQKYKALRQALSEEQLEDKSLAIANRLLQRTQPIRESGWAEKVAYQ